MQNNGFCELSISDIIKKYQKGEITPSDVATICINRVEKLEEKCKAWVSFSEDNLEEQAKLLKKNVDITTSRLPLLGIPIGVKDVMNTIDFATEMGSPLWKGFLPGNDARIIYQIKSNGAIVAGKTVTAEFAVHTLGKTLNPYDSNRTPGTSSSGSAVAVATGMVPASLATQTAGSIMRPASFCGIYGIKPSFGLIPRTGILKTTDSLDSIGYFVHHFEDIPMMFEVLRVHGKNYPISNTKVGRKKLAKRVPEKLWRVAFFKTHTWEDAHGYAKKSMLEWVRNFHDIKDVEFHEVELPSHFEGIHEVHDRIYYKALSYYFKEEYKKKELVSPIMNEIIEKGMEISIKSYKEALKEQVYLLQTMDSLFEKYDIGLSLSTAGEAPLREELERPDSCLMWTLLHLPVIGIPVFTSPSGLPFGVQLMARKYNDYSLFEFASYLRSINLIPAKSNFVNKSFYWEN
ncbi:MAG: amidase [Oligoflexia bacterium]|nr:amidase [Oligoflexia bacterium]